MAWIILFISLLLTTLAYYVASTQVRARAWERFEFRAEEIKVAIEERLGIYEQTLRSAVGFLYATDSFDRGNWKTFIDAIDLSLYWPGIQGLGYAVPVSPDEKAQHIETIRAEGFPDYTIKPAGVRDEYSAIIYLEPFDWRNKRAFGYDMWSNPMRREAMRRARDTGEAATSGKITLVQETQQDVQRGFLTYLPVYSRRSTPASEKERRDEFIGWVYAAFRAGDLMQGILGTEDTSIEFEIYDGGVIAADNLLFDSDGILSLKQPETPEFHKTMELVLQGRPWTLYLESTSLYLNTEKNQPIFILIAGIVIDLLLFYVILSLHFINRQVEHLAQEKTEDFRIAKENEAKANQAKSRFLANMAHELRTPLNSIIGFTNIVIRKSENTLPTREHDALKTVKRNGEHLLSLINDILDLSKIEAGKIDIELAPMDINATIAAHEDDWQTPAAEKNLNLTVVLPPDPLTIICDKKKFVQILNNLLSNAIKYTRKGSITLTVKTVTDSIIGDAVELSVQDTGIGISEAGQQELFNEFARMQEAKESAIEGTGLGLFITAKLVHLLKGRIECRSELDVGSTFAVTLPR